MTGFLEESPGVRSMARLTMAVSLGLMAAVVLVMAIYVLRPTPPDGTVVGGFAAMVTALCGVSAFIKRHVGEEESG